jgi:hypothetical protein
LTPSAIARKSDAAAAFVRERRRGSGEKIVRIGVANDRHGRAPS